MHSAPSRLLLPQGIYYMECVQFTTQARARPSAIVDGHLRLAASASFFPNCRSQECSVAGRGEARVAFSIGWVWPRRSASDVPRTTPFAD